MNDSRAPSGGFLVVRRIDWVTELPFAENVQRQSIRSPVGGLTHEDVRDRYRGFDGWPWPDSEDFALPPLTNGLASTRVLPVLEQYYEKESKRHSCDLIFLDYTEGIRALVELPSKFKFLGYDYGYYACEDNIFSSLLHEVIFGIYADITRFAESLNDNLLLPNIETAKDLDRKRAELLEKNADLERNGEVLTPIAIYGFQHHDS
ncbi:MAG TPA: hypothetical protein VN951_09420 [Pyrinomonadaceae bacterium]|nr:hypothetical protein [Pyrinomonadaceae bacterium]